MTEFIRAIEALQDKIAESQIYADQTKEALSRAKELVDNLHVMYLADIKK